MRHLVFAILMLFTLHLAAAGQAGVGIVISISGTARLRDASGGEQRLSSQNYAVSLQAGESIKADGNGRLQIRLCNGRTETVRNRWYRVAQTVCIRNADAAKNSIFQTTFNFGGRYKPNRGGGEFILFPIEREMAVIRPLTAIFRWMPVKGKVTLSISEAGSEKSLWSKEVDGGTGSFTSTELRNTLKDLREKRPEATFDLKASVQSLSTENTASFRIFSAKDEHDLLEYLAGYAKDPTVYGQLARASIYDYYELYPEVANEYELALKMSPESIELLNAAASAEDRAGNLRRRDEIVLKLKGKSK